jgi:hypothetical protein
VPRIKLRVVLLKFMQGDEKLGTGVVELEATRFKLSSIRRRLAASCLKPAMSRFKLGGVWRKLGTGVVKLAEEQSKVESIGLKLGARRGKLGGNRPSRSRVASRLFGSGST